MYFGINATYSHLLTVYNNTIRAILGLQDSTEVACRNKQTHNL